MKNELLDLPCFIGIGVPKAGTTWFTRLISQHPNLFFPSKKEIHFFSSDTNFEKGFEFYSKFFRNRRELVCGEFSTKYLRNYETVIPRIKQLYSKPPKFICILRDPVKRSLSHYHWLIQLGIIPSTCSLTTAIELKPQIVEYSLYSKGLSAFIREFGSDHMHVIFMEELISNPEYCLKNFFEFMGLAYFSGIDLTVSKGATFNPRFVVLERIRKFLFFMLYKQNLDPLISFLTTIGVSDLYRSLNQRQEKNPGNVIDNSQFLALEGALADEKSHVYKMFPRAREHWS